MSTCLGLYIEENIIKYAKVLKDRDQIKVEAFGVKCYDNIDQTIKQIIEETYSYRTPISINTSDEIYNYFEVFSLLSKKDMPKAIKTEFDAFCGEKNFNANAFETRYALTQDMQQKDRLKVIHISENKIELNKKVQRFAPYKLQGIVPVSMSIPNITSFDERENALIVNIEGQTTITTILNRNIYDITKIENGSQEFLDKINIKENSYQKAYEICKETTIYTSEGQELTDYDSTYLEDIMPTLYEIVGQVRRVISESLEKIQKVYITGTGALINNIDLYFEEYLEGIKCEILKPSFVKISPEINIKDYVEVNSAISLALNTLGEGVTGINFKRTTFMDNLPDFLKIEAIGKNKKERIVVDKTGLRNLIAFDFNVPLDKIEKNMLRALSGLLILLIIYSAFSALIKKQIDDKNLKADESINSTNSQISLAKQDAQSIQNKTAEYTTKINNLQAINEKMEENNRLKKSIPILLNRLMYIMPTEVQLTSIQNVNSKHIEIQAQSRSYAQLGYLTASIKTNGYLTNVISTSGQKENNMISIKIEGDLP